MNFVRWALGTTPIPPDEMSPAMKAQLVKDYTDTATMHPGRVIVVEYGRTPRGELARRTEVKFPNG